MSKTSDFRAAMSSDEFNQCLKVLGLSQKQYAILVGLNPATINRRTSGESSVTSEAAVLLRVLVARPELLELAWKVAGLPGGVERRERGRPELA